MKENPRADIEDAIAHIRKLLHGKKKEFLELVKCDGYSNIPLELKELHLSCLKIFQVFYDSGNLFDSQTALLQSINKAIYEPLATKSSPYSHKSEKSIATSSTYSRKPETSIRSQLHGYGHVGNGIRVKLDRTALPAKRAFGVPSTRKISMCTGPLSCIASMQPGIGNLATLWF